MSKPAETKKPEAKQAHAGPAAPAAHPEKKEAPVVKGAKGHTPLPDGCHSWGCKAKAHRFNFCDEHYDHFKFGLIKKTGEPVSDYEKKIEHYLAFKRKVAAQKVA